MSLAPPLMQHDAGSASGAPLPHVLDFPTADALPPLPSGLGDSRSADSVAQVVPREPLLPGRVLLLAGLAVMGLGGVAMGLALALGLGGVVGVGVGVLMMVALAVALSVLLAHQLAQPARAALGRAESLVRHYAGRSLRSDGDDFTRLDRALDEVSAALLEHAARIRRDHLEELRNSLELQRQYALMRLLRALAVAPRDNDALSPMLASALREIGHYLDWPLGRMTEFAADGSRSANSIWLQPAGGRYAPFIAAVDRADAAGAPAAGGIGACALQTGMPHWITALADARDVACATDASACGLQTALAIPVLARESVVALLEFHADRRVEASAEMVDVVDAICIEVSRAAGQLQGRMAPRATPCPPAGSVGKTRGKSTRVRVSAALAPRNS
jgi:hypothetical protein